MRRRDGPREAHRALPRLRPGLVALHRPEEEVRVRRATTRSSAPTSSPAARPDDARRIGSGGVTTILYLPTELASQLRDLMPTALTGSEAWKLLRFVEQIWAHGYRSGYERGQIDGHEYSRRPKDADVVELRKRMSAEGLLSKGGMADE